MEANVLSLADKRNLQRSVPRALRGLVGQVLGDRIRIDEILGVGGMGVVFRGHHLSMDCPVAIKVALPELGVGQLGRFRREAELGGRLDHPNCSCVFEYNTSDAGLHYMVMPLVDGVALSEYVSERPPPERVVGWVIQLLRGVGHAHRQGIIHRDIKPQNIIVTRDEHGDERIKLVDFGLAKLRWRARRPTWRRSRRSASAATSAATSTRSACCCTSSSSATCRTTTTTPTINCAVA
jgi:serine/threonine protein kinase